MRRSLLPIILFALVLLLAGSSYFLYAKKHTAPSAPSELFINQELHKQSDPTDTRHASGTVADATSSIDSTYKKNICPPQGPLFDCYQKYYKNLTQTVSVAAAFTDLKKRYQENDYVRTQCHPLAHVIGRASAEKYDKPSDAYKVGDSFCWSGYYHGVLETIVAKIGIANLPKKMDGICADIPGKDRYSFDYYNCVHGLGHGVMAITNDEVFKSLTYCDTLSGSWEQISCGSGVFMENIIEDGLNHKTKYLDPNNPLYPCTSIPEKYKSTCYLMQTSYVLKTNNYDYAKTFTVCRSAEKNYQNTCDESLGRDASGNSLSNIEKTKSVCLLGENQNEQIHCVIGAVKDFISYFHGIDQAKKLCESFPDDDLKNICNTTADAYVKVL